MRERRYSVPVDAVFVCESQAGSTDTDSAQTGCCGRLARRQRDNKTAARGEGKPMGAPHEQSAPARVSAASKVLPRSFPKLLSCREICCVSVFHVSGRRRL